MYLQSFFTSCMQSAMEIWAAVCIKKSNRFTNKHVSLNKRNPISYLPANLPIGPEVSCCLWVSFMISFFPTAQAWVFSTVQVSEAGRSSSNPHSHQNRFPSKGSKNRLPNKIPRNRCKVPENRFPWNRPAGFGNQVTTLPSYRALRFPTIFPPLRNFGHQGWSSRSSRWSTGPWCSPRCLLGLAPGYEHFGSAGGSITSVCEPKIIVFTEKNMFGKQRLQVFFFLWLFLRLLWSPVCDSCRFCQTQRRGWWHLTQDANLTSWGGFVSGWLFCTSCCPYLGLHSVMVLANKWIGDKGDFDFKGQHGPSLWYFKFLQVSDDSDFPWSEKTDCPSLMWWTF